MSSSRLRQGVVKKILAHVAILIFLITFAAIISDLLSGLLWYRDMDKRVSGVEFTDFQSFHRHDVATWGALGSVFVLVTSFMGILSANLYHTFW